MNTLRVFKKAGVEESRTFGTKRTGRTAGRWCQIVVGPNKVSLLLCRLPLYCLSEDREGRASLSAQRSALNKMNKAHLNEGGPLLVNTNETFGDFSESFWQPRSTNWKHSCSVNVYINPKAQREPAQVELAQAPGRQTACTTKHRHQYWSKS